MDQLVAYSTHIVPSTFDPHFASHVEDVDTHMMSYESVGSEAFMEERRSFGGCYWFLHVKDMIDRVAPYWA